jgi:hypothetical protein
MATPAAAAVPEEAAVSAPTDTPNVRSCIRCGGTDDLLPADDDDGCALCRRRNVCAGCSRMCVECGKEFCSSCLPDAPGQHYKRGCGEHRLDELTSGVSRVQVHSG